ncbi:hypothetical protein GM658_26675 [Pseudoduganella eburnea]|uniref:Uncharacterized protein n=1 Tax=Massilia eburnea TaxID=1776165 RepID=A0A6L6QQ47_9BURK|nr:hypothetical protein [Massilia eburnea]MTW14204.1 hypothetical protein [Massilia eburnea]
MSAYVYFELGAPDGLRSRFLDDAAEFERWTRELAAEFPGEYPPAKLTKLADISRRGAAALKTTDPGEAQLIDHLTHDYWNFCTITGIHGDKDVTPSAHKWHRYAMELSEVLPTASDEACHYYRRLFAGDSLVECCGHTYRSIDGVFRWSWLLPHEASDFCRKLQGHADSLNLEDDGLAGVSWVLKALQWAKEEGSSLLVSVA